MKQGLIQKPKKTESKRVTMSEHVSELMQGMHEAFFYLGGSDPLQYAAIKKMEIFTFFRFLNSKKSMVKSHKSKRK